MSRQRSRRGEVELDDRQWLYTAALLRLGASGERISPLYHVETGLKALLLVCTRGDLSEMEKGRAKGCD
jgi:hypothetical protein